MFVHLNSSFYYSVWICLCSCSRAIEKNNFHLQRFNLLDKAPVLVNLILMDRLESIKASFHPCLLLLQVSLLKKKLIPACLFRFWSWWKRLRKRKKMRTSVVTFQVVNMQIKVWTKYFEFLSLSNNCFPWLTQTVKECLLCPKTY